MIRTEVQTYVPPYVLYCVVFILCMLYTVKPIPHFEFMVRSITNALLVTMYVIFAHMTVVHIQSHTTSVVNLS